MERSQNLRNAMALGALLCAGISQVRADDWIPIDPAELSMSAESKAPGAAAIILYRQVDRDDTAPEETVYTRIKILTEEGRKYADIQIPFSKTNESIRYVQARTIRPDGSIANFNGTVFEKPIIQGQGVKLLAKAFTFSDVQIGSIIEYRYRHQLPYGYVFDSHWILSQELFTKRAKFSLVPYPEFSVSYSWPMGLPPGTENPVRQRGKVLLDTHDVPAFATEEYMPPENELKYRVDFIYSTDTKVENDPAAYWKKFGKARNRELEDFIDKRRVMEQALSQIVAPSDPPETKLRKIYARVLQVRNTTFERSKSEQELKRENQKDAHTVADVWTRGYGDGLEITWLFLALSRAAGLQADGVLVPTRDRHFFNDRLMNSGQLNSNLVIVRLGDKDLFFDPGTPFTPFGTLPWAETAVKGLRLDKNGGAWITMPLPAPTDARVDRKAELKLTSSGTLEGKLTVTYSGIEAAWRRLEERNDDETDRKQYLEDEVKGDIPSGIDVSLTNKPQWDATEQPLIAEFELSVPGWAEAAGQRVLLPIGIFGRHEKYTFEHANRVHPVYFRFPRQVKDDIAIGLPQGWEIGSAPQPHSMDLKVAAYKVSVDKLAGSLHISREFVSNSLLIQSKYYSQLRDFYQTVKTHDEEQAVIVAAKATGKR